MHPASSTNIGTESMRILFKTSSIQMFFDSLCGYVAVDDVLSSLACWKSPSGTILDARTSADSISLPSPIRPESLSGCFIRNGWHDPSSFRLYVHTQRERDIYIYIQATKSQIYVCTYTHLGPRRWTIKNTLAKHSLA